MIVERARASDDDHDLKLTMSRARSSADPPLRRSADDRYQHAAARRLHLV